VIIKLIARTTEMADAWKEAFDGCKGMPVEIHEGSIFDVPTDAIVAPGNSFGFMDGGLDLYISEHFGWHVQDRVQESINMFHDGELLVGGSAWVSTDDEDIPNVIYAPTMRVPMILNNSVNVYLATKAAILMSQALDLDMISIPAMGTGVGEVSPNVCARQMLAAYNHVNDDCPLPKSWGEAQKQHQLLYGDTHRDLQFKGD
jgi:O-acetyl-ADP-ribose deacetylase (regulator of RNase III)